MKTVEQLTEENEVLTAAVMHLCININFEWAGGEWFVMFKPTILGILKSTLRSVELTEETRQKLAKYGVNLDQPRGGAR